MTPTSALSRKTVPISGTLNFLVSKNETLFFDLETQVKVTLRHGGVEMFRVRNKQNLSLSFLGRVRSIIVRLKMRHLQQLSFIKSSVLLSVALTFVVPSFAVSTVASGELKVSDSGAPVCMCRPDLFTKKYQRLENHWWGSSRSWTCEYTCTLDSGDKIREERVLGSYTSRFFGEDNGDEGLCEGVIMREEYHAFLGKFVFLLEGTHEFSPSKSKSQALRAWSASNCEER